MFVLRRLALSLFFFTIMFSSLIHAGYSKIAVTDWNGNAYTYKKRTSNNSLITQKYSERRCDPDPCLIQLGSLISAVLETKRAIKKDRIIFRVMNNYSFKTHASCMAEIIELKELKKIFKVELVSLINSYKDMRSNLDRTALEKISLLAKPSFMSIRDDLDLSETPDISNESIRRWVYDHYRNPDDISYALHCIMEYKNRRYVMDNAFENDYVTLLRKPYQ